MCVCLCVFVMCGAVCVFQCLCVWQEWAGTLLVFPTAGICTTFSYSIFYDEPLVFSQEEYRAIKITKIEFKKDKIFHLVEKIKCPLQRDRNRTRQQLSKKYLGC